MSEHIDGAVPSPAELSPELQAALQGAVSQTLGSLDVLRLTLRRHVQAQRKRGASLGDIDAQMRKLIAATDTIAADGASVSGELATQVGKWARAFFSGAAS